MVKMSDKELWERCQLYGGNARMWMKKFVALLPEVEKRKLYNKHGFYSVYEFAAKIGGVSIRVTDEVLKLDKKLNDKPLLKAQIAEVGWSKVSTVANIVTKENEVEIVRMVRTLKKPALETYVRDSRRFDIIGRDCEVPPRCKFQSVTFKIDRETQFLLKQYQQKLEKEHQEPISLGKVLKILLKKAQEPIKEPRLSKKTTTSRQLSVRIKYEHNNGGKCAFPTCNEPHEEFHHPNRYSLEHSHENIVPLCKEHHQIAHAGLIKNEKSQPVDWILGDKIVLNLIDKKYQIYMARAGP